jgi:hypothetical protein
MEVVCSSETLVPIYKSTRCHNPEDHHGHLLRRESLKYHVCVCVFLKMEVECSSETLVLVYKSTRHHSPEDHHGHHHCRDSVKSHTWVCVCVCVCVCVRERERPVTMFQSSVW